MASQILVALKSHDRLSQMIPCIEEIAEPGMKVVFLIRFCPQTASKASCHNGLASECFEDVRFVGDLEEPRFAGANLRGAKAMEEQRLSAEHKVFLALEALIKRGIEIIVDVYTGSLRSAMKSYASKGDVHLIVMQARRGLMMVHFLSKAFAVFGFFKRPTFSPVLVLHPTHAV
jgi:hypothetical protein